MSYIYNRTPKSTDETAKTDKALALIFGVFTTLIVGCGLGYAICKLSGSILAGVLFGIIVLLIPFIILGIYYAASRLREP